VSRLHLLPALALTLGLGACFGSGSATTENSFDGDTRALSSGAGSVSGASGSELLLPGFVSPEEMKLRAERHYQVRNSEGELEVFLETLSADGQGNFRLDLDGHQPAGASVMHQPSLDWEATYERRQRYLVNFRDLHRGEDERIRRNYVWETLPGTILVAGRSCVTHRATSRYGYGKIELVVDEQLDLLMGWSVFDEVGQLMSSIETVSIDLAPVFGSITWSVQAAPEQPYRGAIDVPALGFQPLQVHYAPAGYFSLEQKMLLTEQVFGTDVPNLHVEVLDDGLQVILVAQQGDNGYVSGHLLDKVLVQFADLGGVRVAEGPIGSHRVYVVGSAPLEELQATWISTGD